MSPEKKAVDLKTVAARVGLAPCSVSAILNNTNAARAIPQTTKDRVHRAAAELNYRPNLWARSLRTRRTRMVAALAPGLGQSGVARVVAAAQRRLDREGYLLVLIASAFHDGARLCADLHQRGIEGVIAIGADVPRELKLPVTNVSLDPLHPAGMGEELQSWTSELGASAAETIMLQIERGGSQRFTIESKTPGYFGIPAASMRFTAAAEPA